MSEAESRFKEIPPIVGMTLDSKFVVCHSERSLSRSEESLNRKQNSPIIDSSYRRNDNKTKIPIIQKNLVFLVRKNQN